MNVARHFVRTTLALALALSPLVAMSQEPAHDAAANPAPAQQPAQQPESEAQTVHVLVGRTVVVNMQSRLRRVLIGNPAAVESSTTSPTQVVITAKAPGTSSVVLWDEFGHSRILDVLCDVDVSGLRDAVGQAYPNEPIRIDGDQGRVIISGVVSSSAVADYVVKMAQSYGKEPKDVVSAMTVAPAGRLKQIMLKVRFAEIDRTKLNNFGVNLLSTGAGNTIGTTGTQQFGNTNLGGGTLTSSIGASASGFSSSFSVSNLLNVFLFRPDLNFGAAIEALQQDGVLQILAEPNLMAISGQTAKFLAGGEFPYPIVQAGASFNTVTIVFKQYGVKLEFVGTIQPDNSIRLKVAPEVSSLDYTNTVTLSGFVLPAISTRRAESEIELKDGQSFGIAGLLDNRTTATMSKIPGIGDIPILGQFFRSHSVNRTNTELMVMVTPTIVDPLAEQVTPAPPAPKEPIPFLKKDQFDRKLDKDVINGHF